MLVTLRTMQRLFSLLFFRLSLGGWAAWAYWVPHYWDSRMNNTR